MTADGQRTVVNTLASEGAAPIVVVSHWKREPSGVDDLLRTETEAGCQRHATARSGAPTRAASVANRGSSRSAASEGSIRIAASQ